MTCGIEIDTCNLETTTCEIGQAICKVETSIRTRSSTFVVHTKPTHRPKATKELALFATRNDSFVQLERF